MSEVKLVRPFPISKIGEILRWTQQYREVLWSDGAPAASDDTTILEAIATITNLPTWGLLDEHEHLFGIIWLEPGTIDSNCIIHYLSDPEGFGSGLMKIAMKKVIDEVFNLIPRLQHLGSRIYENNLRAQKFLEKLGFNRVGLLRNFVTKANIPQNVVYFDYIRG